MRIYFGTANASFTLSSFSLLSDIHGVAVAPRTARSLDKIIAVSVGGGRGSHPRPPFMFLVRPNRSISSITYELGFGQEATRGRVPIFLDMSMQARRERQANQGGPDVLFINLLGTGRAFRQFAYRNEHGNFSLHAVPGLSKENEERAILTDVNNDGVMEVVHFSVFKIFKLVAPFTFKDVTRIVWPGWRDLQRSVSAVVELDYDNDGWMDLYIARSNSNIVTPRGPPYVPEYSDVLLRNKRGVYVEVSQSAGLPRRTNSMGVTAEDFDNNGFVDILITMFKGPDVLLLNRGDGTFESLDPRTSKPESARGMNVMAVDYDLDGRVDFITGQGWRKAYRGKFYLMRNVMRQTTYNNYLLVRVGNDATKASTALNAVVIVVLPGRQRVMRRVGGRGAQAGGLSLIDTVHFGLGPAKRVSAVVVKWPTGSAQVKRGIGANRMISFKKTD